MKKTLSLLSCLALVAGVLSSCSSKEELKYEYIRLDMANCSFVALGNTAVEVGVSATGKWTVEPSATWIKIESQTDNSVFVNVEDNDTSDERIGTLTFSMGDVAEEVSINQLAKMGSDYMYRYPTRFDLGAVMSPNGKYVGGRIPVLNDDESWTHQVIIIDVDKDEWITVAEAHNSMFGLEKPYCISDNGEFFLMNNMGGTVMYDLDGNYIVPETPAGWLANSADVQATSSDGTVWAGFARDKAGSGGMYYPIKWVNGVPEVLEMPEKNYRDSVFVTGIMARGMSADGSVIYGSSWDNSDFGMCYWDKSGKFHWVGEDQRKFGQVTHENGIGEMITENIMDGMICTAELTNMSPNGRWIAGTWRKETLPGVGSTCAAFYDTENHKTYIFEGYAGGSTCTDDGLGFTNNGLGGNGGSVIDIESGAVLGTHVQWIEDNFGITPGPGFIVRVTPDKSRLISLCLAADVATGFRTTHWFIAPAPAEK